MLAFGAQDGRKHDAQYMALAVRICETCMAMYTRTRTSLAPEYVTFAKGKDMQAPPHAHACARGSCTHGASRGGGEEARGGRTGRRMATCARRQALAVATGPLPSGIRVECHHPCPRARARAKPAQPRPRAPLSVTQVP